MTRQRMIFIGILVIALGALIWDKTRSGSSLAPASAEAVANAPARELFASAAAAHPGAVDPLNRAERAESQKIQKLLATLSRPGTNYDSSNPGAVPRNLFRPPDQFLRQARAITQGTDPSRPQAQLSQEKARQLAAIRSKKLLGTLISPGRSCANIDGSIIALGQFIGPFRLVSIYPERVVLQKEADFINLAVENSAP